MKTIRKVVGMIDKKAFHKLSYGLYIISALDPDGKEVGCVANTFTQIASTPAMVSVSLNKENATTKAILETGKFNVSVLSQSATMDLIGCFGFRSSKDVSYCLRKIPYIKEDCVASFSVDVSQTIDVATHMLFIGEVVSSCVLSDDEPMTYSYYHRVLRGKTPPKAASYDGDAPMEDKADADKTEASDQSEKRFGWRCSLCGYIVEMDELPDDFTCPICGVGKEFFERVEL